MLDWVFEGIVTWISSMVTKVMDAVSGLFLDALGTDMTAMEEYFPFATKAFSVIQYTAWAILFLVTVWQLFRVFGGPITEAENPMVLLARGALFALLIGYAKQIFTLALNIARAPYTALMGVTMTSEDFSFAGIEEALKNGLTTFVEIGTVVGLLLLVILMVSLGWNYFKLLLETVERYVVVGVLCYTSPLAYSLGSSKATSNVFRSWCRMIGSQLLLLVMNVWFLRAFDSSVGYFIGTGGTLTNGHGGVFLWLFCALAFLKTAQRFDSYLASLGLNVAQTGSSMGMELLMAARTIGGFGGGGRTAGGVFKGGSGAGGGTASAAGGGASTGGMFSGFASRFKPNSYVRDAVVTGSDSNMGTGGAFGFVGRAVGGVAARNGATLTRKLRSKSSRMHRLLILIWEKPLKQPQFPKRPYRPTPFSRLTWNRRLKQISRSKTRRNSCRKLPLLRLTRKMNWLSLACRMSCKKSLRLSLKWQKCRKTGPIRTQSPGPQSPLSRLTRKKLPDPEGAARQPLLHLSLTQRRRRQRRQLSGAGGPGGI